MTVMDMYVAIGGTADAWPPKLHNAIVWMLVATVVAYFIKRVVLAWREARAGYLARGAKPQVKRAAPKISAKLTMTRDEAMILMGRVK